MGNPWSYYSNYLGRWQTSNTLLLQYELLLWSIKKSIFSIVPTNAESNPSESETWGRLSSEIASLCIGGRRHLALPIILGFLGVCWLQIIVRAEV